MHTKYLIVGAGLSGLSAAYHLKRDYVLCESSDLPGGVASTFNCDGFKLDNAVHVLYFRKNETLHWIKNILKVELLECERRSSVWINNSFVDFPIQYNLNSLPLVNKINSIGSIFRTFFQKKKSRFENFEEYSINTFGKYLTNLFLKPYNEKLFGINMSDLNIDWFGDYVPTYSKTKMVLSVAGISENNYGRNSRFYYPISGGISAIANGLYKKLEIPINFNASLDRLSLKNKTAIFSNGSEVTYDYLINTIPLKIFLEKIDYLSSEILSVTGLLKKNPITILHILCRGNLEWCKNHWIYVPDQSIPFYRITLPGNINPANCPQNHFGITLEFGGIVLENDAVLNASIATLKQMHLINNGVLILDHFWKVLECGYVIYDNQRSVALKKIFPYLRDHDISSIGRYGNWEYSNMEDAIIHGKNVAEQLIYRQ